MNTKEKRCSSCYWHRVEDENGDGVCVYKSSDFFIDRTDNDFVCEKWEAREDGKENS